MLDFLIHSPVEHFARTTPDHPALVYDGQSLSYRELDDRSTQLARALRSNGLKPGDRVGLFLRKSLELGVAIYGALKAGGVFVPLDPFMPAERLAFILDDCAMEHVVTDPVMLPTLGKLKARETLQLYGLESSTGCPPGTRVTAWADVAGQPVDALKLPLIDLELGYIMYTSGSTGHPKGMMHSHRGSTSYARWGALHVGLTPGDRVASHAPLHFDLSIFDFFSTAQSGATVVMVPEAVTKFPASWTQIIEKERISVVFTVPYTLIEMLAKGAMDKRDLSSLRWILFGGEPYPPKHLRALQQALPDVQFTNVYGPAEAPSCTCYDVPPLKEGDERPLPIGLVSHNSSDLILDEDDQPCEVGQEGELCIRSSTLTLGYWNRPDLNERCYFRKESFGPFPNVWFRTGDVVVRYEDGLLRFLGRRDRMVKTRGHRVELDEVEAALARHPVVAEAAAFTLPDQVGSRAILAAVICQEGAEVQELELRNFAKEQLPSYALPTQIRILNEFPRTSGGKIDRRALAESSSPT